MLNLEEQLDWHKKHLAACQRNVENAKKQMDHIAVTDDYCGREKTRELEFLFSADLYARTLSTLETAKYMGALIGEVYA